MYRNKINFFKRIILGIILVIVFGTLPNNFLIIATNATATNNSVNIKNTLVNSKVNPSQLVKQGRKYYQDRDYTKAIKAWQQARDIYQYQQDKLNQATVFNYLCLAYIKLGQLPTAETVISSSLELLDSLETKNPSVLAQTLNTQGSLKLAQGNTQQAILTWQEATKIYKEIEDKTGEIGSLINQAQGMQELGLYIQAEKTLTQVKDILTEQTDERLKIVGLRKLGNIQRLIGNLTKSETTLQESLELARVSKSNTQISNSLLSLGNTALTKGEHQTALDYYQQAINISSSHTTKIKAQLNQLKILIDTKEYIKAVELSRNIKPQIDRLPVNRSNIKERVYGCNLI